MAYEDQVWAIIGGIDGPTTHLAEQVVAKALLTLVSPASTDRSVNLAGVPWMFSCMPSDDLLAGALSRLGWGEDVTLVSATDHDSRVFTAELKKAMGAGGSPRPSTWNSILERTLRRPPRGPRKRLPWCWWRIRPDSVRFLRALHASGFSGRIYAGPWVARLTALGAAEGVVFPFPLESLPEGFPDYAAVYAYDATNLVLAAIRKAGLNRVRIYDAIRELSPYTGASGVIRFDALGRSSHPVRLSTVRDGRVVTLPKSAAR